MSALGAVSSGVDDFLEGHAGRCQSAEDAAGYYARAGQGTTQEALESLIANSAQHAQAVGELGGKAAELQRKVEAMAKVIHSLVEEAVEITGDAQNLKLQDGVERQTAIGLSQRARDIADSL